MTHPRVFDPSGDPCFSCVVHVHEDSSLYAPAQHNVGNTTHFFELGNISTMNNSNYSKHQL